MDNNIFRVNGEYRDYHGTKQLELAVELAMRQKGYEESNKMRVCGWSVDKEKGLILHWYQPSNPINPFNLFMVKMGPQEIVPHIAAWLDQADYDAYEKEKWTNDCKHDGHNGKGFLLYMEDWGHVRHDSSAMFAVKPCYMWYGK